MTSGRVCDNKQSDVWGKPHEWGDDREGETTEKERHLTVSDRPTVLSVVTGPLSRGASGEGGGVLRRSGLGGSGSGDDSVLHSVVLLKSLHKLSNS